MFESGSIGFEHINYISLFRGWIRADGIAGELAENIRDVIDRRRQQPNGSFERRLIRRAGMRTRRDEGFGQAKALAHGFALLGSEGILQGRQIRLFLLLDVL